MVSLKFLLHALTIPVVVARTVIQYFTVGTVYSRTNAQFKNSLKNNIYISVLYHLTHTYNQGDVRTFIRVPLAKIFAKYKDHYLLKSLVGYGDDFTDKSKWLVKQASKDHVLVFIHGGGYALNIFDSQFWGIVGLYHGVPSRSKLSVLVVDYSLTTQGLTYPTQIRECLDVYAKLVAEGYKNIHFVGDSAGGNMSLALTRIAAYPEDAQAHFSRFKQFEDYQWPTLPQPQTLLLVSPWVEPLYAPKLPTSYGIDTYGDLGAVSTEMAEWYIGDLPISEVNEWFNFARTDYSKHWAHVDALNDKRRNLVLMGEREVLRDGVEDFIKLFDNTIEYRVEDGGIHDNLFYVEGREFADHADTIPRVDDKFGIHNVGQFLELHLSQ